MKVKDGRACFGGAAGQGADVQYSILHRVDSGGAALAHVLSCMQRLIEGRGGLLSRMCRSHCLRLTGVRSVHPARIGRV